MKGIIISPLFLVFGALVLFSLGMLFGLGYLRYYVDGNSINRRAIHSTLILNLWEEPHFLPGELNLLKGNQEATISEDGKTMILSRMFSRNNTDLFISEKSGGDWSKPVALSGFINTGYEERGPHLSRDGKWLMFQSNRPDTRGGYDLYISQKVQGRWTEPVNLGDDVNTKFDEGYACFSPDGTRIFFSSNRPKEGETIELDENEAPIEGDWDLYQSKAIVAGDPANDFLPIYGSGAYLEAVNTDADEMHVVIPSSGKHLLFASDREGGIGGYDIWMSRRYEDNFIEPENLGKPINSRKDETFPALADRGSRLVFVSNVYSIHPRALKYYGSQSREVLSRFDYALLRNVLLIILLLIISGIAIHYLLKFLLDSELKLLPRCLIASFLLHLILAALTGSLFITSKIEETLTSNLQEMTINMNALTRESISVSIRESVASLPRVEAPTTLEQMVIEIPLKTETPINNRVNPYPDRVNVKETVVASERFTQVRQAQSKIKAAETAQQVAKLNFSNSNLLMESPEGLIQAGEGDALDPNTDPPVEETVQDRIESRRLVDSNMESQPFDTITSIQGEFDDTITEAVQSGSIADASRSQLSGNLSSKISKGLRDSLSEEKSLEISSSSPTSVAFDQTFGMLVFETNIIMEVVEEDEEEEEEVLFIDFLSGPTGRAALADFGFDRILKETNLTSPDGMLGQLYSLDRFKEVKKQSKSGKLSRVFDLLKNGIPQLTMEVDSELEIPEYMLEDFDESPVRPVF